MQIKTNELRVSYAIDKWQPIIETRHQESKLHKSYLCGLINFYKYTYSKWVQMHD